MAEDRYKDYARDEKGWIKAIPHANKPKPMTAEQLIKADKPEKLSYWDRRKNINKKSYRNYHKF